MRTIIDAKDVRSIISLRGNCCCESGFFSQKACVNKSILNLSVNCATYARGQVVSRSLIGRPEIDGTQQIERHATLVWDKLINTMVTICDQ